MSGVDVHTQARQLLEPFASTELATRVSDDGSTTITTRHRVVHPSLLEQLQQAAGALTRTGQNLVHSREQRIPTSLNALDALAAIKREANAYLDRACAYRTPHAVRLTYAEAAQDRDAAHLIGRWWHLARSATGWDTPPFRPNNTCPLCGTRGTIRIRASEQSAWCATGDGCGAQWDSTTIGLLAEHVRRENDET